MPDSITVAAFVFGLVLLMAALIGKELKIAAVEMPTLSRNQRLIAAGIGVFLVVFGLTEGKGFAWLKFPAASAATTPGAVTAPVAVATSIAGTTSIVAAVPIATAAAEGGNTVAECFAEVPEADRIVVGIENQRRTDRKFGSGQPREAILAIQFRKAGVVIGSIKFQSHESGIGFDIMSVMDNACNPIANYENASRPDQPKEAPYSYDTLNYDFGEVVIGMDIAYGEGNGKLQLRAEQISP